LYIENEVSGFLGFDDIFKSHEWKDQDLLLLKICSQIIGNALQRYRVESMLKKSEERYRLIIENINDLIFILNLKFHFEFINEKGVLELLGYQKAEILGKNCINFIYRDDIDQVIKFLNERSGEKESKIEIRFQHKEGHWRWFECKGQSFLDKDKKIKWLIISRDITDRKLAEKRYKDLFDNSPNAIFLIDFKGFIIDANSTVEKLFKFNKYFFIGKSIEEFNNIFQLDIKAYFKTIFQASFKKNFPKPIEIQIKKGINNNIWIKVQASLIKQESKTIIQLLCENITEKKKAELLEEKFKVELEKEVELRTKELNESFEQQKLYFDQIVKSSQFKTEFMAMMSHELRTPLNAIIGFTDLLLEGVYGELNLEQKEFINDIKSSAEHQFDMIKHILDISKIESGQTSLNIQKFSLGNMLEQIRSSLKPLYSTKDLKVKIKGLDEEKYIYADPFRFKEILLNLLTNAIKFTIEGKITLTIKEKYNQWLFKVTDTGIGIARKDFPLIFKEFRRVDSTYVRSVPGTGLGLSLTKRLIELHGGEISFTSMLGSGSTFTFSISKKLNEKFG
ncbi:MAG: PAS domain S-box protein, partial [Promethearchaeota archaeon]